MVKKKSTIAVPGSENATQGPTVIEGDLSGNIGKGGFRAPEISKEPWIADPILFSGVSYRGDGEHPGVYYRLKFADFMNIVREIEVSRVDCFMNFPSVLARLVNAGYCMDITNPEAIKQIQRRLTLLRIDPKAMKDCIKKAQAARKPEPSSIN